MSRRVHFAIPGDPDTPTGGYAYDRRLGDGLAAHGWAVRPLRLADGFPAPDDGARAAAAAAFAALPPGDALLVDGLAGGVLADALAGAALRGPVVYLCHHPLGEETGLAPAHAAALAASERAALAAAMEVVVTSPATAATLASTFTVPPGRITVAVPGTDPAPLSPGGGSPPVLLCVASLIRRKGHDVLIDALDRIRDLSWRCRLVGGDGFDPDWASALRARVAALDLSGRIAFAGPVADPAPDFAAADIFVLPSRHEGYGMVFAEALARGLPVVAARAGAVPDVVPEAAGALVPPEDPDALAAALRRLIVDPQAMAAARDASRRAGERLPTFADTARLVAAALDRAHDRWRDR